MTVELLGSVGSVDNAFLLHARTITMKIPSTKTVYVAMIIVPNVLAIYSMNVPVVNQDSFMKSQLDHLYWKSA